MTDEEFFKLTHLGRQMTDEEFRMFFDEWQRRLPELRRRTDVGIENLRRASRGLRPIR